LEWEINVNPQENAAEVTRKRILLKERCQGGEKNAHMGTSLRMAILVRGTEGSQKKNVYGNEERGWGNNPALGKGQLGTSLKREKKGKGQSMEDTPKSCSRTESRLREPKRKVRQ